MDQAQKKCIREMYRALLTEPTALGFDEERCVGVVSLLDHRKEETTLVPVAEISIPILQEVVNE